MADVPSARDFSKRRARVSWLGRSRVGSSCSVTAPGAVLSDELDRPLHERKPPPPAGGRQRLMRRLLDNLTAKDTLHTPLERAAISV
jgi:hypothetical protein